MSGNNHTTPKKTLRKSNSSGHQGVSWAKNANKWGAYIRVDGKRKYLGLFQTAEAASDAYRLAALEWRSVSRPATPEEIRAELLAAARGLYDLHGPKALSTPFLEKQKGTFYHKLLAAGLGQSALTEELGLTQEYGEWRDANRTYRGKIQQKWSWEIVVKMAREIKEREVDLPTLEWCRLNGSNCRAEHERRAFRWNL